MSIDSPAGRREVNKARTREALVEAATRLLHQEGLESLTAEKVADAAGISRRTFFNYFPSVEAVFAYKAREVQSELRLRLAERPEDEPLIDGAKKVVVDLFTLDRFREAVHTWRIIDSSPAATRYFLEDNESGSLALAQDWARERLGWADGKGPDSFRLTVLTAAFLSAFGVARRSWLTDHPGPVDVAGRDRFTQLVGEAFEYLRPALEHVMTTTDQE